LIETSLALIISEDSDEEDEEIIRSIDKQTEIKKESDPAEKLISEVFSSVMNLSPSSSSSSTSSSTSLSSESSSSAPSGLSYFLIIFYIMN
jgi:hypothetical protein